MVYIHEENKRSILSLNVVGLWRKIFNMIVLLCKTLTRLLPRGQGRKPGERAAGELVASLARNLWEPFGNPIVQGWREAEMSLLSSPFRPS